MKVLIDCPENRVAKTGGPPGYLYQLKKGLDSIGSTDSEVFFLPASQITSFKRSVPTTINNLYTNYKLLNRLNGTRKFPVDINEYDAIHFHSADDLYSARECLERYSGKVLLTQHTPCASHLEKKEILSPFVQKMLPRVIEQFEAADLYSFAKADLIIFPCEEAEEPYFNTWEKYYLVRDESKIGYLPTGTEQAVASKTRDEIRKRYGIPEDALVFSYVGRHNQIKGYDLLISIFSSYLAQNPNAWVLCAGAQGPVSSPKTKRWIEVGWTDDPHSLIAASDAFVLPNRQTYFDLVMLEVLSLGIPVFASYTGGNKYFERFQASGVIFFDSKVDAMSKLARFGELNPLSRMELGFGNKELYQQYFTEVDFARNYIRLLRSRL